MKEENLNQLRESKNRIEHFKEELLHQKEELTQLKDQMSNNENKILSIALSDIIEKYQQFTKENILKESKDEESKEKDKIIFSKEYNCFSNIHQRLCLKEELINKLEITYKKTKLTPEQRTMNYQLVTELCELLKKHTNVSVDLVLMNGDLLVCSFDNLQNKADNECINFGQYYDEYDNSQTIGFNIDSKVLDLIYENLEVLKPDKPIAKTLGNKIKKMNRRNGR